MSSTICLSLFKFVTNIPAILSWFCSFCYFSSIPNFIYFSFRLINFFTQNVRKSTTPEDKTSLLAHREGSDVKLGSDGSNETLFDVCSSPLADFHICERMHQEGSHQVSCRLAI